MKRVNTDFEGLTGVTFADVAVKFQNAPNKNVALATYIVLRASEEYPDLVKQSQTRPQLYAQLAQHFAKTPKVQDFIKKLQTTESEATQSSLPRDIDSRVVTKIKQFYSLYDSLLAKPDNPSIFYATLLAKSAVKDYLALKKFLRTIDSYVKTFNDIDVKESDIAFLIPSFKVDKEKKKSISQKDLKQLLASRATTLKELIKRTLSKANDLSSLFVVDEDKLNKALLDDVVFQQNVQNLSA